MIVSILLSICAACCAGLSLGAAMAFQKNDKPKDLTWAAALQTAALFLASAA